MQRSEAALDVRERTIVKTSVIGIGVNLLLAAFKAAVGFAANSISVILDAVNNLSDALSSVITIIGAKVGARKPDREHPLGHGRAEFISSMIVAAIVLYAGVTSLVESVKKIIHPAPANYSAVSIVVIAVAVAVKLALGTYVKRQGRKVDSGALTASGRDALFDALISASVLASAVIYIIWRIPLEAYVGVLISLYIIKAGIGMALEAASDIIGQRGDAETSRKIKDIINSFDGVRGAYDLALFNYGPKSYYGSADIELPDTMSVAEADAIARGIQAKVYSKTGVILTAIGVYSFNTGDDEAAKIRNAVQEHVLAHEWALQLHGFFADTSKKTMRFDAVISFDIDRGEALMILHDEIKAMYPDYAIEIVADADLTD